MLGGGDDDQHHQQGQVQGGRAHGTQLVTLQPPAHLQILNLNLIKKRTAGVQLCGPELLLNPGKESGGGSVVRIPALYRCFK